MEWLSAGGMPAKRQEVAQVAGDSPRRKGIRRASKLMFFSGVLFPIFLRICIAVEEGGPMIVPFGLFFVALVMMLYARLFSDNTERVKGPLVYTPALQTSAAQNPALGSDQSRSALPPAANNSIPTFGTQPVRTNELVQPPSVTENTTRLLDQ